MKLTGNRILLAVGVLVAALVAFLWFGRADESLRLQVQVSGMVNAAQAGTGGTYGASGTGLASGQFGNVSLSGSGSGQLEANCASFDGTGELVTAAGMLQLQLAKPGRACVTQTTLDQAAGSGEVDVAATIEATGTSGSLLGRHGRLKAHGTYNPDSGAFTVLFSGRLRH